MKRQESKVDVKDGLLGLIEPVAKVMFLGGALATVVSVAFLVMTYNAAGTIAQGTDVSKALHNAETLGKVVITGGIVMMIGGTIQYWEEEVFGALTLLFGLLLFFLPAILGNVMTVAQSNEATGAALQAIQTGGGVIAAIGFLVLLAHITVRITSNVKQGSKREQLKYGKQVKEQKDVKNVLLGKCWQLPYCRKFVREVCPIYHSGRTCWKERVGCMCEEQVLSSALSGKTIPKDAVLAAQYIPKNNKLSEQDKRERCNTCVIYNEHQRHKYKVLLPTLVAVYAAVLIFGHGALSELVRGFIRQIDSAIGSVTLRSGASQINQTITTSKIPLIDIMTVCIVVMLFVYTMRLLEYVIFKLKI